MEQKTKAIILIVIIVVAAIVGIYFFQKNKTTVPTPQAQAPAQTAPVESQEATLEYLGIPEDITTLPGNQLILMEDALKIDASINERIEAGTLSAEEGEKQKDFLRTHLAPPPISDTVSE
ncbi:MAG: hypothetical protein ABIH39_01900 [Candidatus Margulisiibacteriota bacterium]